MRASCKNLILVLMLLGMAGCGTQIRETFDLGGARVMPVRTQTPTDVVFNKRLTHVQILIAPPSALKALDGEDIVVSGGDGSIFYLKQAQLSDRLPQMIQTRLIQAFEDTGLFGGVGRPGEGLATNYQVLSDVRSFGIISHSVPQRAKIEISVKIIDDRNGVVRATQIFSHQQAVWGDDNGAYAQALERAFSVILTDIVNWTVKNL